mmetsp:Transcript_2206/g.2560  ORF Transcript_2206/g.2560 Transcript_2206/m.2560 type:complete len:261 (-) Transcript_2206:594-1376(-)
MEVCVGLEFDHHLRVDLGLPLVHHAVVIRVVEDLPVLHSLVVRQIGHCRRHKNPIRPSFARCVPHCEGVDRGAVGLHQVDAQYGAHAAHRKHVVGFVHEPHPIGALDNWVVGTPHSYPSPIHIEVRTGHVVPVQEGVGQPLVVIPHRCKERVGHVRGAHARANATRSFLEAHNEDVVGYGEGTIKWEAIPNRRLMVEVAPPFLVSAPRLLVVRALSRMKNGCVRAQLEGDAFQVVVHIIQIRDLRLFRLPSVNQLKSLCF